MFKFDKPFLDKQQLLEMFNLSNGTLERYKEQWLKDGKDLSEMGHLPFKGYKGAQWDPVKFLSWLYANKLENPAKYDFEVLEQEKLKASIHALNQNIGGKNELKRKTI